MAARLAKVKQRRMIQTDVVEEGKQNDIPIKLLSVLN